MAVTYKEVKINMRDYAISANTLSYDEVVERAFDEKPQGLMTVVFHAELPQDIWPWNLPVLVAGSFEYSGSLHPGSRPAMVVAGMVFTVCYTGNA